MLADHSLDLFRNLLRQPLFIFNRFRALAKYFKSQFECNDIFFVANHLCSTHNRMSIEWNAKHSIVISFFIAASSWFTICELLNSRQYSPNIIWCPIQFNQMLCIYNYDKKNDVNLSQVDIFNVFSKCTSRKRH